MMKVARQTFCEKFNIDHKLFMSSSDKDNSEDNAYNVVENKFLFCLWISYLAGTESHDSSLSLKIMNL